MSYADFLKLVASELGVAVPLASPCSDFETLPRALHELYSMTDGLQLPFAELHCVADIRARAADRRFGPAWLEFGFDGYTTYYLVSTNETTRPPIAAFDPQAERSPDAAYESVLELLEDEYGRHVEDEFRAGDLHVVGIPESTPLSRIVQILRHVTPLGSSELLRGLREAPLVLTAVNAPAGISTVRKLHALGVTAFLKNVRPERAG